LPSDTRQLRCAIAAADHGSFYRAAWGGQLGWSRFQLTADGRSYTVITMADDPAEWHPAGAHDLRAFIHRRMGEVKMFHIHRQMGKNRAARLAEREMDPA
jgi:hypothetical protein